MPVSMPCSMPARARFWWRAFRVWSMAAGWGEAASPRPRPKPMPLPGRHRHETGRHAVKPHRPRGRGRGMGMGVGAFGSRKMPWKTQRPRPLQPRAPRDEMMRIRSLKSDRQPPPNLAAGILSLIVQPDAPTPRCRLLSGHPLNLVAHDNSDMGTFVRWKSRYRPLTHVLPLRRAIRKV